MERPIQGSHNERRTEEARTRTTHLMDSQMGPSAIFRPSVRPSVRASVAFGRTFVGEANRRTTERASAACGASVSRPPRLSLSSFQWSAPNKDSSIRNKHFRSDKRICHRAKAQKKLMVGRSERSQKVEDGLSESLSRVYWIRQHEELNNVPRFTCAHVVVPRLLPLFLNLSCSTMIFVHLYRVFIGHKNYCIGKTFKL